MGRKSREKWVKRRIRAKEAGLAEARQVPPTCCIFCCASTTAKEGAEHVFPANLGSPVVLPRGTVCSKCNNSFSKLDVQLMNLVEIAGPLASRRVPGRDGKPRKEYGAMTPVPEGGVRMRIGRIEYKPGETVSLPLTPREHLDEGKFNRALCKIALNLIAHIHGPATALRQEFDELRHHVLRPKSGATSCAR